MLENLETIERFDVVVCGGGLAGVCAAVAAARHGAETCLVQDRPVLGGNSSSEVRVTPNGAATFHAYARETGIISELLIEERAQNHQELFGMGATNSIWDMILYDKVVATPNLTLYLNTIIMDVEMAAPRAIRAITARVANAELTLRLEAQVFIDCTGDGVVAAGAGCTWRLGTEGRDEFAEPHAPPVGNDDVMGSSILFRARDVGRPAPFKAPAWATVYKDASFFYDRRRIPRPLEGGYWWMELSVPWHTIFDNETIRHELTRHVLGVWDWIKNKDPELKDRASTYALEWVGQVPGKRESRRILGRYLMSEHDPLKQTVFPDEVAFGGWYIDLHTPGGLLATGHEPTEAEGGHFQASPYMAKSYCGPYGIPLRILIAQDVDNLMMAGRNVSVTHAALGTVRVQGTTALLGQAAGTAAATAVKHRLPISVVPERAILEVQQALLRDSCFLPNVRHQDPNDLAQHALVSASSEARCSGVAIESCGALSGMSIPDAGTLAAQDDTDWLRHRRGQWIAVGTEQLEALSVCVTNDGGEAQEVDAWLVAVDHLWDYRVESLPIIAHTTLMVSPGTRQWVTWPVATPVQPGRYLRLDLAANPGVRWHTAGALVPAHPCAFQIAPDRMRGYGARHQVGWTMSFQIIPSQPCFDAGNVLTGETRPYRYTNLWRSDPNQALPQWLELNWPTPQQLTRIELTFPGQLFAEVDGYAPFYRDPQCPKAYRLLAWCEQRWQNVLTVEDNYQRHCRHTLAKSVITTKVRLVIDKTNGDPCAAVYEVRCY